MALSSLPTLAALDERTASGDLGNLVVGHSEQVTHHLDRMLPETWGGEAGAAIVPADAKLMSFIRHVTHFRMAMRAMEGAVGKLRIAQQVAGALDRTGGDAMRLEQIRRLVLGSPLRPCRDRGVNQIARRKPAGGRVERRLHQRWR